MSRLSPAHLVATTLVLGAGVSRLGPLVDPDVWWHLRTGRYILQHHALPGRDPWSLVADGHPWIAHEWLSQVLMAVVYDGLGYRGLSVVRALGVLTLLAMLAVQAFRRTTPYRALAVTTLAVFATSGGWGERPQLLSFILLVPAGVLARRGAAGKIPWLLIPLTWVWANLHGLWFLGVALVGAAAIGTLIDRRSQAIPAVARVVAVCGLSAVVAALTPNGPALVLEPLHVGQYARFVSEWGPPSIRELYGGAFFGLLAVLLLAAARRGRRLDWAELLPILLAAYVGASYIRTVAPAAVMLVPYVASVLKRPSHQPTAPAPWRINAVLGGALVSLAALGAVMAVRLTPVIPPHAPIDATRAIEQLPGPQRVINEYDIGGWLLWWAPTARPAVDGRTEIYDPRYLVDYFAAMRLSGDHWKSTVANLHATVALLHVDTPLVVGLRDVLGWRVTFEDDTWVVLTPPTGGPPA